MQDALSHRNYGSIIVLAWKHLLSPCNLHFSCFFWEFHGSQWPSIFHNISCISSVCLVIPCLSIYLFFLSASPMHSGFQLICLSNQYLACRHLCIASAVSTAPLHLTAWAVFSSKLNSSSSLCLKSLFLSFNILKLIFSAFFIWMMLYPQAVWVWGRCSSQAPMGHRMDGGCCHSRWSRCWLLMTNCSKVGAWWGEEPRGWRNTGSSTGFVWPCLKITGSMSVMNRDTSVFISFWHLLSLGLYWYAYSLKKYS